MKITEPASIAQYSGSSSSSTGMRDPNYETASPTPPTPLENSPTNGGKPRPMSTATAFSTAPFSIRSTAPLHTLNIRFSGEKGHPVHPRHFMKEFNIAMRDMGVVGDREKMDAFGDYLVVDSPAEVWYLERMAVKQDGEMVPVETWRAFQDNFAECFRREGKFDPQAVELQRIKSVKFRQTAAVSAHMIVKWREENEMRSSQRDGASANEPDDGVASTLKTVKLCGYKPIATEEIFLLSDFGVPEGAKVQFVSRVWGVGEYNSMEDVWFIHDNQSAKGADFRQSGTAFKGWFNYTGKYEM